jgi:hypothetical protein
LGQKRHIDCVPITSGLPLPAQPVDGRVVLQRCVCLLCFPQGVVCHHMHNGIQMRIDLGDTI